eukprot:m.274247 g.274247  ORF g.274247 m.274247 type:complete len:54 (+) comp40584_c0_seq28:5046-5207(+)
MIVPREMVNQLMMMAHPLLLSQAKKFVWLPIFSWRRRPTKKKIKSEIDYANKL